MAGYVRQSTADIIPTATVRAAPLNAEYNAIRDAFSASGGHKHDGTAAEGPVIGLIGDPGVTAPLNKVVVDDSNNQIEFSIDVSSTSTEQFVVKDGVIEPTTDDDIDLEELTDNVTVINGDGKAAGYWGDIATGPFLCHGKHFLYIHFS